MNDDEKSKLLRQLASASSFLVLDRMRLHGFWPKGEGLPPDPPDEASARTAILAEIQNLHREGAGAGLQGIERALREERLRRWEESKARRAKAKALRQAREAERRAAWRTAKAQTIVHVGTGYSEGLEDTQSNEAALRAYGLPVLHTAADVAASAGISLPKLRWLTFHRRGSALVHYHRYSIPKKTGGMRAISAPKAALADLQLWVLSRILEKLPLEAEAHGFVRGRSILTNAAPHVQKRIVVNVDLKDFFPTVTFRRVKGYFRRLGYSEHVATLLALICTEPPRVPVAFNRKTLYVAIGERVLPQGACTSPMLTNLLCRRLDRRLAGLAKGTGFSYSRYADDLTFSADREDRTAQLMRGIRSIVEDEGFVEHPSKTKVMRRGRRQEVTGLTVNDKLGVSRTEVRTLRALLHNATTLGLASQNRKGHPNFEAHLRGRIAFIAMVDAERGAALRAQLNRVLELRGVPTP
jgi:RNA-directed DNA polymerase